MTSSTPAYQFPCPLAAISNLNRTSSVCFCARHDGRGGGGGSRWESRTRNRQHRFGFAEEFRASGRERDAGFGSGDAANKRNWWSDDEPSGEYGFGDDDEDFDGFGALEGSIGFSWIFKVLKAFGWMVPAVIVSTLSGGNGGTNTIFMALALPLAQSAFSLLLDTFSGGTSSYDRRRPKPPTRTKKQQPYATTDVRRRGGGEEKAENENEATTKQSFGGWDELDDYHPRVANEAPEKMSRVRNQDEGKLGRRRGNRKNETSLLLRLLMAIFPPLGSWRKLL
ncbi:unnamed protein product [Cuscuta campestris]|uniref:Uncharacterized protein n=2 Tax=Cuscuta sect. Cleistogrammica TaxID=1824901 RepID=A0A484LRI3_9ASTE|nr:hypothetical protein DM860_014191 [Cuscuta australis]VFQ78847.1 unnamed protein product [Cuscuta campestris]